MTLKQSSLQIIWSHPVARQCHHTAWSNVSTELPCWTKCRKLMAMLYQFCYKQFNNLQLQACTKVKYLMRELPFFNIVWQLASTTVIQILSDMHLIWIIGTTDSFNVKLAWSWSVNLFTPCFVYFFSHFIIMFCVFEIHEKK